MQTPSNKTSRFSDSVIRRMTRVSNRYGAINLPRATACSTPPCGALTVGRIGWHGDHLRLAAAWPGECGLPLCQPAAWERHKQGEGPSAMAPMAVPSAMIAVYGRACRV